MSPRQLKRDVGVNRDRRTERRVQAERHVAFPVVDDGLDKCFGGRETRTHTIKSASRACRGQRCSFLYFARFLPSFQIILL